MTNPDSRDLAFRCRQSAIGGRCFISPIPALAPLLRPGSSEREVHQARQTARHVPVHPGKLSSIGALSVGFLYYCGWVRILFPRPLSGRFRVVIYISGFSAFTLVVVIADAPRMSLFTFLAELSSHLALPPFFPWCQSAVSDKTVSVISPTCSFIPYRVPFLSASASTGKYCAFPSRQIEIGSVQCHVHRNLPTNLDRRTVPKWRPGCR